MPATPRIADVQITPLRFQPGDRLLVKSRQPLDAAAMKKLKKTVERWAGDHVEVLVIDLTKYELEVQLAQERNIVIPER